MMDDKFVDWCNQLRVEMHLLSEKVAKKVGMIVDSAVPYRLGWSPKRAARAILGIDYRDCVRLSDLSGSKPRKDGK